MEIDGFDFISEELAEINIFYEEKTDSLDIPDNTIKYGGILSLLCC